MMTESVAGREVTNHVGVSTPGLLDVSSSTDFYDKTSEMNRLMSFGSWPSKNMFPQPSAFVSAGFYYTGEGDKTKCFSCNGEVVNWKPDMYPDEVHRRRFPHCHLVKGEETRNKPMQPSAEVFEKVETFFRKKSTDVPFICRNKDIAIRASNPRGVTNPTLVKRRQSRAASGSIGDRLVSLSIPASLTPTVDYIDMRYEQARLRSFVHWPKSDMIQPSNLARAGMYFIGPGDRVQCAFCKGKLEGWIRGDNPLEEHRKHFGARCRFMQGAQVGNVPIVQGDNPALSAPPVPSSRCTSQVLRPRFPEYADEQRRSVSCCTWLSQTLHALGLYDCFSEGSSVSQEASQPRYPEYADIRKREKSFLQGTNIGRRFLHLAAAGLFFASLLNVQCYDCGGSFDNWMEYEGTVDDWWCVHAKWFPDCQHVLNERPGLIAANKTGGVSLSMYTKIGLEAKVALPDSVIAQEVGSAPWTSTDKDYGDSQVGMPLATVQDDISDCPDTRSSAQHTWHTVRLSIKRCIARGIGHMGRLCCCAPKISDGTRKHIIQRR